MITVWLNDEAKQLEKPMLIEQALAQWPELPCAYAIAVNKNFVPKSLYDETVLNDGDSIELVTPMKGG